MVLSNDEMRKILTTKLMASKIDRRKFKEWRERRISEALALSTGPSNDAPHKHVIDVLPDGIEVHFLKPGKETQRAKPNVHDMTPRVGDAYTGATFQFVWERLCRLSVKDYDRFRLVQVLTYRNMCYHDHALVDGKVRYRPSPDVSACISELDGAFKGMLPEGGLLGLMHFLDILAWNEDVKYHVEDGKITFDGRYDFNVGRRTFFLTCIQVTYSTSEFVRDILRNRDAPLVIDFGLIFSLMQQFAKTRGIATTSNKQILIWLGDLIFDR